MARFVPVQEALDHPLRKRLLAAARDRPGVSLGELAGDFAVTPSTILWHGRKLVGADLLRMERHGPYRLFFSCDSGSAAKQAGLRRAALRAPEAQVVFDAVKAAPGATVQWLAGQLGMAVGSARSAVLRLARWGLVQPQRSGRVVRYFPSA